MQKNFVILVILLFWGSSGKCISRDSAAHYLAEKFGRHFAAAKTLLAHEGRSAVAYWQSQNLPANVLLATVAPELMRYHALSNAIEMISLEMMYVNFGQDYANFSVGFFQMKPAFAESLEKFALRQQLPAPVAATDTTDTKRNREKRLERLATLQGQSEYLALFYRVMMCRFPHWRYLPANEQVRWLATAYNAGWQLNGEQLQKFAIRNFFTIAHWETGYYNYSQVALHFFALLSN